MICERRTKHAYDTYLIDNIVAVPTPLCIGRVRACDVMQGPESSKLHSSDAAQLDQRYLY